ncbi:MAG: TIGR00268 family protein [Blastopirellula sp.]|nr:MAG: TIGR00268 family protein [Blastopirellula sp.]
MTTTTTTHTESTEQTAQRLVQTIAEVGSCAVAFSGGVDSSVVAKAAQLALGDKAIAVTGRSASVSQTDLSEAAKVAKEIGMRHLLVDTHEGEREAYIRNESDRCFHCKTELYSIIDRVMEEQQINTLLNGANVDDQGDHRPGMIAAKNYEVRSPLIECGINKQMVRQLAQHWNLPVWDRPASPCLASRIAYGEQVTPARLKMIEQAEAFLRDHGLHEFRVRYHRDDLARVEVPLDKIAELADPKLRDELVATFQQIGFRYITIDLEGFRSGNLNQLVSLELPS